MLFYKFQVGDKVIVTALVSTYGRKGIIESIEDDPRLRWPIRVIGIREGYSIGHYEKCELSLDLTALDKLDEIL